MAANIFIRRALLCLELTKHPVEGFSAGLVDDNNIFEVRRRHSTGNAFEGRLCCFMHTLLTPCNAARLTIVGDHDYGATRHTLVRNSIHIGATSARPYHVKNGRWTDRQRLDRPGLWSDFTWGPWWIGKCPWFRPIIRTTSRSTCLPSLSSSAAALCQTCGSLCRKGHPQLPSDSR